MRGARTLAALSCAAGLVLPACQARPGWEGFVAATGGRRLVEPRLTGGFAYAPCHPADRAAALIPELRCASLPLSEKVQATVQAIQRTVEHHATPQNLQADALSRLVQHREEDGLEAEGRSSRRGGERGGDRAVEDLARALDQNPHEASLWSDLAAAHLLRAERTGDPYELIDALEAADRAVALDLLRPEALFNRALVLERLFLEGAARAAWQRYLEVEPDPAWRQEGRTHLAALKRPPLAAGSVEELGRKLAKGDKVENLVRRAPKNAREATERRLLRAWADFALHGNQAAAARALSVARKVGQALARGGERMILDCVAAIDAAEGRPERLRALAAGHLALARGRDLYDQRQTQAATPLLESARAALQEGGSPAAATADFFLAICVHYQGNDPEAAATFARLQRELAGSGHESLTAHVAWMSALLQATRGQLLDSLVNYRTAASLFERLGEGENAGSMHTLLADSLEKLGRHRQAWQEVYSGLRAASGLGSSDDRYLAFTIASDHLLKQGRPEIALYFQDEVVAAARKSANLTLLPDAYFWRASIEHVLGRTERELADLGQARRLIASLPDPAVRERLVHDLAAITAEAHVATDPRAALPALTAALAYYEKMGHHLLALRAHRARAHAYLRLAEPEPAEADLLAALAAYERLGRPASPAAPSEDLRLAFLQESEEIFDEVIAFEVERERPVTAWVFADRARTRVLPESALRTAVEPAERQALLATEPEPLPLDEIERRLPPGTTLLEYSVLKDRIFIWRIRRGRCDFSSARVAPAELEREVAALRRTTGNEAAVAGEALFARLLRQPLTGVPKGESLVVVPDKALHAVPFAALRGPDGHYLVEDHRIVLAPSATLYVRALDHERTLAAAERGPAHTLVFGDPAFDVTLWNDLKPLAEAAREAERIAALDPTHSLLRRGKSADKAGFLALAPGFERIHVAAHALVDGRNPLLSALVFAPGAPGDSGALYAREIYQLRLPRTRLVVLAACDTGNAYLPGSEGATTLGRAFLAAGVPTVVASLWAVDDNATARLLSRFHRELQAGADPASALRQAQIATIHDPQTARLPADWGAFEVFGASLSETKPF
jgi:CHAT domain-containing protein